MTCQYRQTSQPVYNFLPPHLGTEAYTSFSAVMLFYIYDKQSINLSYLQTQKAKEIKSRENL